MRRVCGGGGRGQGGAEGCRTISLPVRAYEYTLCVVTHPRAQPDVACLVVCFGVNTNTKYKYKYKIY